MLRVGSCSRGVPPWVYQGFLQAYPETVHNVADV